MQFQPQQSQQSSQQPQQIKLTNVQILDQSTALNVLVGFISMAHSKGIFDLEESAKIWECIKQFQPPSSPPPLPSPSSNSSKSVSSSSSNHPSFESPSTSSLGSGF